MWRFGIGSPPSKKKKQTTEEKRAKGRKYDHQKRVRNFDNKWTLEFPWVKLNHTRDDETDTSTDMNIQSWSHVLKLCEDTCPNLIGLVDIVLCLSVTSVECERGFSVMRKTKSDWRNCLSDKALTDQMRVMLVGKDIESYDPDAAVKLWLNASARPRRMNVKTYRKRKVSVIDDSSSASGSDESD